LLRVVTVNEGEEKIEAVLDIKCCALYLHEQVLGSHSGAYGELEKQFEAMVDKFYQANNEAINERQYKAARNNYEYFMVLIDQLLNAHQEQAIKEKQESGEGK